LPKSRLVKKRFDLLTSDLIFCSVTAKRNVISDNPIFHSFPGEHAPLRLQKTPHKNAAELCDFIRSGLERNTGVSVRENPQERVELQRRNNKHTIVQGPELYLKIKIYRMVV